MLQYLICIVVGYFLGCISSGYFVGKLYHVDIRTQGSGNAGTTNVLRTLGKLPALITFVGDLAKAIVPIVVIRILFDGELAYLLCLYCGLGVVLGHNFPFYLHFKGGKGIAVTSAFVLSAANPIRTPIGLAIFAVIVGITRYVSLGSLIVAWYIPANTLLFHGRDAIFVHEMIISLLFTVLAYVQHRQNIVRLLHGNENKIGAKKKEAVADE